MEIKLHKMEPWLRDNQRVKYNLGQSGVEDVTVGELFGSANISAEDMMKLSLGDNDTLGTIELRERIASLYANVGTDNILVTSGSSEAILLYFMTKYTPGSNVVILAPAFQTLSELPNYLDYEVRYLHLRKENRFRIELDKLESLIDDNTSVLILNNPHNPTGMRLTKEEIIQINKIVSKKNVEVLADEHYRFLPHSDEKIIPSLVGQFDKVSAVGSMIKCFGCVGLRMGWLIGEKELIERCRNLKDYTTHTICSINDHMSQRVLSNWEELSKKYKSWILENKKYFNEFISKNSEIVKWIEPEAGIVAFPYFIDNKINVAEVLQNLIDTKQVFLLPGETFEVEGHFRICLGKSPVDFKNAIDRFQAFLNETFV